jgi:hydroxyethylthiazole kinase-like uncharacterized protein yjeF
VKGALTHPVSVAQMRAAEQALFDAGTDPYALMVCAGEGAAEIIWRAGVKRDAIVLCGPGNNGGDGYVIARRLRERGVPVRVAATGEPKTDSAIKAQADWGGPIEDMMNASPAAQLVDALFGIGLTRGLDAALAGRLGELVGAAGHSYAIDVPSGIESDAAVALSFVPQFTHCIAMGAWKPAHVLLPSRAFAAQHVLVDIGPRASEDAVRMLTQPCVAAPAVDAHKYSRGLVVVMAGAMPGAAALCAEAAARAGAGYVRLIGEVLQTSISHAIVCSNSIQFDRAMAVLVGPGLGRTAEARDMLELALGSGVPVVADADALHFLAEENGRPLPAPAIMTPHEGEFVRLFGKLPGNKIERTRKAAAKRNSVVVHKGTDTVIAAPDGRCIVAPAASPWLSTAGTGDVLAGLCAARLAVTGDAFRAAGEAVWLHAEAARRSGSAFVADDLARNIPAAIASAR